ncbi:MAG: acyltransferase [Capsulimonadales bacterium]|nr:acyltransferase [Capsulimonadales bacterium]
MPPGTSADRHVRLPYIDALRGIACLWVIFYHASIYGMPPFPEHSDPLLAPFNPHYAVSIGYLGVHLFLVLSGFCLTYPLLRRTPLSEVRLDLRDFARRRAKRILPPYYVALALFAPIAYDASSPLYHPTVWFDVPAHLLLIHNVFPETINTINGSFWSLALECQLYLLFPLLLGLARKYGFAPLLLLSLAIGVLWQRGCLAFPPPADTFEWNAPRFYAVPGRLFQFVCGMAAACLITEGRSIGPERISRGAMGTLAAIAPIAVLATRSASSQFTVWADHLWAIVFAALVVTLHQESPARFEGRVGRIIVGVGTLSYSLYLVHQPLLQLIRGRLLTLTDLPPVVNSFVFWLFALPLVIMAGRVFYGLVESPKWRHSSRAVSGERSAV